MNSKQRQILSDIFKLPTPKNILFRDLESLLCALGCEVIEGDGSRMGFKKNGLRVDVHRPHPGKEAKPYQIRAMREFLETIGVKS